VTNIECIQTPAAPTAIGPYSQAIKSGALVFLSGQIPLDPDTMALVEGGIDEHTRQVFRNLSAVAEAADACLQNAVKLTIYLTDLNNFTQVNNIMAEHFSEPYPARATIQVSALPKQAMIEVDAIVAA